MADYLTDEEFMLGVGSDAKTMSDDEFFGRQKKDIESSHKPSRAEGMKKYEDWWQEFRKFKGVRQPMKEGEGPGGRGLLATLVTAPSKFAAMAADVARTPAEYVVANREKNEGTDISNWLARTRLFNTKGRGDSESTAPFLGKRVQDLQNMIAGKDLSEDLPSRVVETAATSLMFPGSQAKNVITAVNSTMADKAAEDLPLWARLPIAVAAGTASGTGYDILKAGRLPSTFDPRVAAANQRVRNAFEGIPEEELVQGAAAQKQGFLAPTQAIDRSYPQLSSLEAEIMGSGAKRAREFQKKIIAQPKQAEKISDLLTETSIGVDPIRSGEESAAALRDAARLSIGSIERTPNVLTKELYDAARANPGVVSAERINAVRQKLLDMQRQNRGRKDVNSQIQKFIDAIDNERKTVQQSVFAPLDEIPLDSNTLTGISRSLRGEFDDLIMQGSPSLKGGVKMQVQAAGGLLDDEARAVSEDLRRASSAQRGLRPDYKVDEFNPLQTAAQGGTKPYEYIASVIGDNTIEPRTFRTFITRISEQDPNAVHDALGHYMLNARNKAFSVYGPDGNLLPASGVRFANELIGNKTAKEQFKIMLEAAGKSSGRSADPTSFAEGVIRMVEFARRMDKPVFVDVGRAGQTQARMQDIIKMGAGHTIMAHAGGVNLIRSFVNKFSDEVVASMLNDKRSIELLTAAGKAPIGEPASKALMAYLAYQVYENDGK